MLLDEQQQKHTMWCDVMEIGQFVWSPDKSDSADWLLTIIKKVANLETLETVLPRYLRYGTSFKVFSCAAGSIKPDPTVYFGIMQSRHIWSLFKTCDTIPWKDGIFQNWILMIQELIRMKQFCHWPAFAPRARNFPSSHFDYQLLHNMTVTNRPTNWWPAYQLY